MEDEVVGGFCGGDEEVAEVGEEGGHGRGGGSCCVCVKFMNEEVEIENNIL